MSVRLDRRQLLLSAGAAALVLAVAPRFVLAQTTGGQTPAGQIPGGKGFTLPPLPYTPAALEPHIDATTMSVHHDKHHQAYVDNLNKALANHGDLQAMPLADLLKRVPELPESIRTAVRNNGGGHANHSMFWSIMGPNAGGAPDGEVGAAITRDFGSFDDFKTRFNTAGAGQFGSGWVFVTADPSSGKLAIAARPNQDSPAMDGVPVLMGNDVWEHAYYLKYQNRRADYLAVWWNVVDWGAVNRRYAAIRKGELVI